MNSVAPAHDKIYDAFIAYSGADCDLEWQLDQALRDAGLRVYFAKRMLLASEQWDIEIPKAQRQSLSTVVVLRGKGAGYYCRAEITNAINLQKLNHIIIVIAIDGAALTYGLENLTPLAWNAPHDLSLPELVFKIRKEVGVSSRVPLATCDLQHRAAQLLDAILFGNREEIDRCRVNVLSQFERVVPVQDGTNDTEICFSVKDALERVDQIITGICQSQRVASIAGTEFKRLRRTRFYDEVPWGDVKERHLFHLASATALVASELVSDQRPWSLSDLFIARIIRRVPARIRRLVTREEVDCQLKPVDADIDDLAGIEDAWPREVSPYPPALKLLFEYIDKDNHAKSAFCDKCLKIVNEFDVTASCTRRSFDLIVAICAVGAASATTKDDDRRMALLTASRSLLERVSTDKPVTLRECLRVLIGRHWYAFALKCQSPTENRQKTTALWRCNAELRVERTDLAENDADWPINKELRDVCKNMVVSARFNEVLEEFEDAAREATKYFLPKDFPALTWLESQEEHLRGAVPAKTYVKRLWKEIGAVRELFVRCAQPQKDMNHEARLIVGKLELSARKLVSVSNEVTHDEHLTRDFREMAKDHASHANFVLSAASTVAGDATPPTCGNPGGNARFLEDRIKDYVTAAQSKFWPWENVALDAVVRVFGVPTQVDQV